MPYNRDTNRKISAEKLFPTAHKTVKKTFSDKSIKLVKIHCAEAFSLGTFITRVPLYAMQLIGKKVESGFYEDVTNKGDLKEIFGRLLSTREIIIFRL